jgi:4-hydroxyphenylpyruvate dioxygenase-like putative hemolysin
MKQAKFSVQETQTEFLSRYKAYGFKDKSAMLRYAIDHLQKKLEREQLKESADLYSEIYAEDDSLSVLTDTAVEGWPE